MHILIYEHSIDGIFSGIYEAYARRYGHRNTELALSCNLNSYQLFCEYEEIPVAEAKSRKVSNTLRARFGSEVYSHLCEAISAYESPSARRRSIDKAEAVYKTVVLGLSLADGSKILDQLGNPYVNRVFQLSRSTFNEAHHLLGFLRFSELENGILFARIHPKNDVLALLADHFTDRLPLENFIIYDQVRKIAAVHKSGSNYMLAEVPNGADDYAKRYSDQELEYRRLWLAFFHSIAVEARKNPHLQDQNLPKRFRPDMVEFHSDSSDHPASLKL